MIVHLCGQPYNAHTAQRLEQYRELVQPGDCIVLYGAAKDTRQWLDVESATSPPQQNPSQKNYVRLYALLPNNGAHQPTGTRELGQNQLRLLSSRELVNLLLEADGVCTWK